MKYKKIKDTQNLLRDTKTNAVINTDREALENAKASKQKRLNDRKRIDTLEEKVDLILELLQKDNK